MSTELYFLPLERLETWYIPLESEGFRVARFTSDEGARDLIREQFGEAMWSDYLLQGNLGGIVSSEEALVAVEVTKEKSYGRKVPQGYCVMIAVLLPPFSWWRSRKEKAFLRSVKELMERQGAVNEKEMLKRSSPVTQ